MTFRGDALEILGEFLIKTGQLNSKSGLVNYQGVPLRMDYGVDGTGINPNGEFTVVQFKFRSNPMTEIPYSDLSRTYTQGVMGMGLPGKINTSKNKNLWLITNGKGANHVAHAVFGKKLHVLGHAHLSKILDNNVMFWYSLLKSM